jgi:hypothetical protein
LSPQGLFAYRILVSTVEEDSLTISDKAETQFSMMISEPEGMFEMANPCVTRGSSFVRDF